MAATPHLRLGSTHNMRVRAGALGSNHSPCRRTHTDEPTGHAVLYGILQSKFGLFLQAKNSVVGGMVARGLGSAVYPPLSDTAKCTVLCILYCVYCTFV
jgi:hypothetical protein